VHIVHPAVAHLAAAADHLGAGRDLLQTHFRRDADGAPSGTSYWAPAIISGQVTAALLTELAGYLQQLALWTSMQSRAGSHLSNGGMSSPRLALRNVQPLLELAAAALRATQQARYPAPDRELLDAIPANISPPRQSPSPGEPVRQLCQRIFLTAERLCHATFSDAARDRWSPTATSTSWRRDALASAITTHSSGLLLSALAERAMQLELEPRLQGGLHVAAEAMVHVWTSWRDVASRWDIVTTGVPPRAGVAHVTADVADLALFTGQLAYGNSSWTPARRHSSPPRRPADLAPARADILAVLGAVHHAANAIQRTAEADHQAALAAADDARLYVPTRLLPDKYDIPQPYTPAPAPATDAVLDAYSIAIQAATHVTATLDDLATMTHAPSHLLAEARQVTSLVLPGRRHQTSSSVLSRNGIVPAPGRTEQTLHRLQLTDPALLLRAAVIDQATTDLNKQATATRSRARAASAALRPKSRVRRDADPAPQVASQDVPRESRKPLPKVDYRDTPSPSPNSRLGSRSLYPSRRARRSSRSALRR
jgi:hypothetical protein